MFRRRNKRSEEILAASVVPEPATRDFDIAVDAFLRDCRMPLYTNMMNWFKEPAPDSVNHRGAYLNLGQYPLH